MVNRLNAFGICDFIRQYTGPSFKVQFAICVKNDVNGKSYSILCYRDYRSEFAESMKRGYEDVTILTQARLYTNTEVAIKLDGRFQIDNEDQMVKLR